MGKAVDTAVANINTSSILEADGSDAAADSALTALQYSNGSSLSIFFMKL